MAGANLPRIPRAPPESVRFAEAPNDSGRRSAATPPLTRRSDFSRPARYPSQIFKAPSPPLAAAARASGCRPPRWVRVRSDRTADSCLTDSGETSGRQSGGELRARPSVPAAATAAAITSNEQPTAQREVLSRAGLPAPPHVTFTHSHRGRGLRAASRSSPRAAPGDVPSARRHLPPFAAAGAAAPRALPPRADS